MELLSKAKRPVIIAGWGLHLSGCLAQFREFVNRFNVPVALTWGGADLLSAEDPNYIGTFGTHGQRHSNFAVQNADLILSLGSRLDTKSTGTPINSFAREAKKIMVDIDHNELDKFDHFDSKMDLAINCCLTEFFYSALGSTISRPDTTDWRTSINQWREDFDSHDQALRSVSGKFNPYQFVGSLIDHASSDAYFFLDTGSTLAWTMQAFKPNGDRRIFHDFNNTAMGWAIPACFGAWTWDK